MRDGTTDDTRWSFTDEARTRLSQLLSAPPADEAWFRLRQATEQLTLSPGFERLIALEHNTIRELPHQIDVALRVLRAPFRGRAVLADEVGLGKTIEAGIILKELTVRGLARRVLIITPAALVGQWQAELQTKFFERFVTPLAAADWLRSARLILSYDRARQKAHREQIMKQPWDLVIVDEAHKIKNHTSAAFQLVRDIEKNFILLLTATPLQNNLRELYNLVTLLRPGQLGTWGEFRERFLVRGNPRRAKDPDALRDLTASVMVRTRRASVAHDLALPPRKPAHPPIHLSDDEARLYRLTVGFLRQLYRTGFVADEDGAADRRRTKRSGKGILVLELSRLCQRLTSSAHALADSLRNLANGDLITPEFRHAARSIAAEAEAIREHAKLRALEQVLAEHDDQLIVFSEHLPTLRMVRDRVRELDRPVIVFQGGLTLSERLERLAHFQREQRGVFIATRSGAEGLNLQFCNRLVNYELPWNPMVIEQRIGRIHRIGQKRETHIINFAASGTIEAHILQLLDQKIQLFRLVVGELDVILGEYGGGEKLEKALRDGFLEAKSDGEFERYIERLGSAIEQSREEGIRQEQAASAIAPQDNAARLEHEFQALDYAGRLRLGIGTSHVRLAPGVETQQHAVGVHVDELFEALEAAAPYEHAGTSPYGPLIRLTCVTGRGRALTVTAQADRLPMTIVQIEAEP